MMWSMCRVAVIVWDRPLLQGLLDDVVYVSGSRDRLGHMPLLQGLLDDVVYVSGSRDRLGQAFITRLAG